MSWGFETRFVEAKGRFEESLHKWQYAIILQTTTLLLFITGPNFFFAVGHG